MGSILPDRRLETLRPTDSINTPPDIANANAAEDIRHLRLAAATLDDHKAIDIIALDLRGLSDATDFFLLASGSSDTHVKALAEHVVETLKQNGRRPHHVEGLKSGRWALLDYVDFVVHVFHPTLRQFYQLERLWADALILAVQGR